MYKGELMEEAKANDLYCRSLHPYTQLLFSSAAGMPEKSETTAAPIQKPNVHNREADGNNCTFSARCPKATERCFCEHPELKEINPGHSIRCFNYTQISS
jgi:oligopeptide/dipeptide ABC transporter ATP-binding protein